MKIHWTFQRFVLFVGLGLLLVNMTGCYSTQRVFVPSSAFEQRQPSSVTVNMGQLATVGQSSEQLLSQKIEAQMTRVKKIIDLDDPNLNPRVLKAYKKAHAELDEMFIKAQICEAENLVALKHNVLSAKDCSVDGFVESPNYSNYGPALNPRNSQQSRGGNGNGGGNVVINSHNTTSSRNYAPPIGDCRPYWLGYRVRVKWHRLQGWQCHYGGYVDTNITPYPYGVPYSRY